MLPNWLTGSQQGQQPNNADDRHVVLGTPLRAPLMDDQEEIIFGCGCFWGAEKGFWRLPGVVSTAVGYAGGQSETPSYEQVCSGRTGHTEVVRVVWSAPAIDVSDLLKLFGNATTPPKETAKATTRAVNTVQRCTPPTPVRWSWPLPAVTPINASCRKPARGPSPLKLLQTAPSISLRPTTSSTWPSRQQALLLCHAHRTGAGRISRSAVPTASPGVVALRLEHQPLHPAW